MHRDDEPAALRNLIDERGRHLSGRARHEDPVVWGFGRPAHAAVRDRDLDIVESQAPQRRRRLLRERSLTFDRDDAAAEPAEDRRLVARPGAYLEHDAIRLEVQRLRHERHHQRLRDGLAAADRECAVLIGMAARAAHEEFLARDLRHHMQHPLIGHPMGDELLSDHPLRRSGHFIPRVQSFSSSWRRPQYPSHTNGAARSGSVRA